MFFYKLHSIEYSTFFPILCIAFYLLFFLIYNTYLSNTQLFSFVTTNVLNIMNIVLFLLLIIFFFNNNINFFNKIYENYTTFSSLLLFFFTIVFLTLLKSFAFEKKIVSFESSYILFFSIFSLLLIISSNNFITFCVSVELQSFCFYFLAGLNKKSIYSAEASLKYFISNSFSSCLLLFGISINYLILGTVEFESLNKINYVLFEPLTNYSYIFILTAFLFKLGTSPFHMWLIDVYDGAPLDICAFFMTIPKLSIIVFFFKFLFTFFFAKFLFCNNLLLFCGLSSICLGSLSALYQKRIKRLLVYSTISHTGFIILNISCVSLDIIKTSFLYLIIYILTNLCIFGLIFFTNCVNVKKQYIINWAGFFQYNCFFVILLTTALFSLAGLPPLAGFYTKLCILVNVIFNKSYWVTFLLAIFTSVSCFYYIKVVKIFFFNRYCYNRIWLTKKINSVELITTSFNFLIMAFLLKPNLLLNSCLLNSLFLSISII